VSLAFVFIPISVIALSDIPAERRGNATGLFNATRELGGSIGTAWMGLLLDRNMTSHTVYLSESVTPYNPLVQEQYGALAGSVATQTASGERVPEAILSMKVKLQALVLSFQDGFRAAMFMFLLALVFLFFLKRPKPGGGAAGAH
jgi:DHA2 family multidrug resistance protein